MFVYTWRLKAKVVLFALCCTSCSPSVDREAKGLGHVRKGVRIAAAEHLGRSEDPAAVPHLLRALKDPKFEVRLAVVEALGELRDRRAVTPLMETLSDSIGVVRWVAIEALGIIGDSSAALPLLDIVVKGMPQTQLIAIEALGEIGDTSAVAPLVARLTDRSKNVRWVSSVALGKIGDRRAIGPLLSALVESEESVRRAVVFALDEIEPEWRKSEVVMSVAQRLGEALITETITGNERYLARYEIILALDDINPKWRERPWATKILNHYLKKLRHSDVDVRRAAAYALRNIGDHRAVEPLLAACNDSSRSVRGRAIRALGAIGDSSAIVPLIGILQGEDRSVWPSVATALGQLKARQALPVLIDRLDSDEVFTARAACRALGTIKNSQAVVSLLSALEHTDSSVRNEAAKALGSIGDKNAVSPLLHSLESRNVESKIAIRALESIDPEWKHSDIAIEFVRDLAALLGSGDAEARISLGRLLGSVRNRQAVEVLEDAMIGRNLPVIAGATHFLVHSNDVRVDRALIDALNSYGNDRTASILLGSGRPVLRKAARTWALRRGRVLLSRPTVVTEKS